MRPTTFLPDSRSETKIREEQLSREIEAVKEWAGTLTEREQIDLIKMLVMKLSITHDISKLKRR